MNITCMLPTNILFLKAMSYVSNRMTTCTVKISSLVPKDTFQGDNFLAMQVWNLNLTRFPKTPSPSVHCNDLFIGIYSPSSKKE